MNRWVWIGACWVIGCGGAVTADPDARAVGDSTDATSSPPDAADQPLTLFDAHIHQVPGWTDEFVLSVADEVDFVGIAVLGPVLATSLQDDNPGFAFAFANLRRDSITRELLLDQNEVDRVIGMLDDGARGVGEISVRHFPAGGGPPGGDQNSADDPFLLQIYDAAAARGVPINIHFDYGDSFVDELHRAFDHNPDTIFVWAHSGDAQPDDLRAMLAAHDNLRADISSRVPHYWPRGPYSLEEMSLGDDQNQLRDDWRELFEDYPRRFLFGSDVGPAGRDEQVTEVVEYYLGLFENLSPGTARRIASENARELFGTN